jgi:hypothetical protein
LPMEVETLVAIPEAPIILLGTSDGRILSILIGKGSGANLTCRLTDFSLV